MNALFYSSSEMESANHLERVIEMLYSKKEIKICRTIASLEQKLRQPLNDSTVIVLLVSSKEDLLKVLSLKDLLWDRRIILILPDSSHDTVATGHTLRPRFVSYHNSYVMEVPAVLYKMTGASDTRKRQRSATSSTVN